MMMWQPVCKPDVAAFATVLDKLGLQAGECVMIEDSMKNIRAAKRVGMRTVLVRGRQTADAVSRAASEATKAGDAPEVNDPSVDCVID